MLRALGVLLATLGYATLRYNVFKKVPWEQWPVYVTGKALGLSALILLVWLLARAWRGKGNDADLASWAVGCMLAHVAISLAIMTPLYYPKYFCPAGKFLTLAAGFSWLLGGAATAGIFVKLRRCELVVDTRWLGMWGAVVGVHAAVLGFGGWFQPWTWPGYMVPITLLSAILGLAASLLGVAGGISQDRALRREP